MLVGRTQKNTQLYFWVKNTSKFDVSLDVHSRLGFFDKIVHMMSDFVS